MADFYEKLEGILKKDERFISDEGELIKSEIINMAYNIDENLITRLLNDEDTKDKFFKNINGNFIFNILLFVDYIQDKKFLIDSYTKFSNKIGLTIDGKSLNQRGEVALVWPFKDCILEGSMDNGDEKSKKEIFFNEILAEDEISRLKDRKVLTNGEKYNSKGSQKFDGFKRKNGTITDNLIIKGNNLLALHSLYGEFAGKVKLIYIDPPYNTGNDGFNYNDNFNHSTWLTFMKNRLDIARKFLTDDGICFVHCDDNEQAYLKVLMDELFNKKGEDNFVGTLIHQRAKGGGNAKHIVKGHDYVLIYAKKLTSEQKFIREKVVQSKIIEIDGKPYIRNDDVVRKIFGKYDKSLGDRRCFYEELEEYKDKKQIEKIKQKIKNKEYVLESNGDGKHLICKYTPVEDSFSKLYSIVKALSEDGNNEISSLNLNFKNPKPEKIIEFLINSVADKNDIMLDYHLGSGTTCAVAHKMGIQYIGIEQMDYIKNVTVERMKKVIAGEQGGISESVSWQGGGEFIYFELREYNEEFITRICKAKDSEALKKIWEYMKEKSFLKFNVDYREKEEAFKKWKKLDFGKQQKALISLLDKNHLYVNYSEMEDENFDCTDEEKKITTEFYNKV